MRRFLQEAGQGSHSAFINANGGMGDVNITLTDGSNEATYTIHVFAAPQGATNEGSQKEASEACTPIANFGFERRGIKAMQLLQPQGVPTQSAVYGPVALSPAFEPATVDRPSASCLVQAGNLYTATLSQESVGPWLEVGRRVGLALEPQFRGTGGAIIVLMGNDILQSMHLKQTLICLYNQASLKIKGVFL